MFKKLSSKLRGSLATGARKSSGENQAGDSAGTTSRGVDLKTLYRLLLHSYNEAQVMDLARSLNVDYGKLPGQSRSAKTRELIMQLHRRDRIPELLAICAELRPEVDWHTAASSNKESTAPQLEQSTADSRPIVTPLPAMAVEHPDLYLLLEEQLSDSEFSTICFDIGIDIENLPDRDQAGKAKQLLDYLARRRGSPQADDSFTQLVAACTFHRPDLDWLQASGIEINQGKLPDFDRDGYKTAAIRNLLLSCFETYEELNDFCQNHFPHAQGSFTVTLPLADNVQALIGFCFRRGTMRELLETTGELFPNQFNQFGPYTTD